MLEKERGLPVVANEDGLVNVQLVQELNNVRGKVLAGIGLHIETNALGLVLNCHKPHNQRKKKRKQRKEKKSQSQVFLCWHSTSNTCTVRIPFHSPPLFVQRHPCRPFLRSTTLRYFSVDSCCAVLNICMRCSKEFPRHAPLIWSSISFPPW